ncbi:MULTISPECIES: hypothetical protein [unclassified Flavobacterium]
MTQYFLFLVVIIIGFGYSQKYGKKAQSDILIWKKKKENETKK